MGDQEPPPDKTPEVWGQPRSRTHAQAPRSVVLRLTALQQPSAARDAAMPWELSCAPRGLPLCVCSLIAAPFAFYSFPQWVFFSSAPNSIVTKSENVSITPRVPAPLFSFPCGCSFWGFPFCFSLAPSHCPCTFHRTAAEEMGFTPRGTGGVLIIPDNQPLQRMEEPLQTNGWQMWTWRGASCHLASGPPAPLPNPPPAPDSWRSTGKALQKTERSEHLGVNGLCMLKLGFSLCLPVDVWDWRCTGAPGSAQPTQMGLWEEEYQRRGKDAPILPLRGV